MAELFPGCSVPALQVQEVPQQVSYFRKPRVIWLSECCVGERCVDQYTYIRVKDPTRPSSSTWLSYQAITGSTASRLPGGAPAADFSANSRAS
ncbi:hypothetical protein RI578_42465 (plasmid) [Streptomyces sp. BB1-1-1]|uniref:hypothetical protein n=1 Tax=Streptomyces sp. BB1-1-1 TaxID=3074430 RepID=UPI002877F33A|nr:hypothetical protein [Streptomyces sp. BB1-1-1]WND32825.1 hypothetical protein RI578_00165 [Streptomyces sp. BB1-1-1]WND40107.1 hypothetical protein RI578_40240 [Streptomyces sp. BB1-1-1]WND40939.1 hypothetical protein RI578_42465 [Streptomyces sp. BB1-1-1]